MKYISETQYHQARYENKRKLDDSALFRTQKLITEICYFENLSTKFAFFLPSSEQYKT